MSYKSCKKKEKIDLSMAWLGKPHTCHFITKTTCLTLRQASTKGLKNVAAAYSLTAFRLLETSSKRHEESVKEPVALKLKIMANQCVRSWRTERNHVSQSLAKYKRRSSSSGGNSDLWTQHSKIRFKAEPERANLTKFLSSLEVEMADAVASLQEKIPQKVRHTKINVLPLPIVASTKLFVSNSPWIKTSSWWEDPLSWFRCRKRSVGQRKTN